MKQVHIPKGSAGDCSISIHGVGT